MAASALAMKIAQWIAAGMQGPPPAGATPADVAAVAGGGSSTKPMGPVAPAAAAASPDAVIPGEDPAKGRALPYPTATDEYERARNLEERLAWAVEDAQNALNTAQSDPDQSWKLGTLQSNLATIVARQSSQQGVVNTAKLARDTAAEKATKNQPHSIQKQEKGPDGQTYVVTYTVDAQGNETWNGEKPTQLDLGTKPTAALELQEAQLKFQQAQLQLAAENDPLKKQQLQTQVDQARFTLEQAQARAPLELQTAQLGLQKAQQDLNRPGTQTINGRVVGIDPLTGKATFSTDLLTPEERARTDETAQAALETARRGTLPTNAVAAYTQEAQRLQGEAQRELDRLKELQRQGSLTASDADQQFQQYLSTRVTPQLAGLRTQAEEAQRAERQQVEERNRLEQIRADAANTAREQLGYQAGETARGQIMQIAPQIRTPQFLQQLGQSVQNMSQRAAARTSEEANALPRGQTFTADTFNPANFAGAIPNLDEAARQATARALSGISPTAARLANLPSVALPTGPDLQALLAQVPYQGALLRAPAGVQPLPGQGAIDLGTGQARSVYPGGGFLDWQIPAYGPPA